MDRRVIDIKFETIRRCVARIESKGSITVQALCEDHDLQDIVSVNLERAVQASVDAGAIVIANSEAPAASTMAEVFAHLGGLGAIDADLAGRMRRAVGLRNVLVHTYQSVNWDIVHAAATQHLDDLRRFVASLDAWVDTQS